MLPFLRRQFLNLAIKHKMKHKYRKSIYYVLACIMSVIIFPFLVVATFSEWVQRAILDLSDILKYKLRIFEEATPVNGSEE